MASSIPNIPLSVSQGSTFTENFVWTDINGNPIDLTGMSAKMQIRSDASLRGDLFASLSSTDGSGTIVLGASSGGISLMMPASATGDLCDVPGWQKGYHEFKLVYPDGITVFTLFRGVFTVESSPTRMF